MYINILNMKNILTILLSLTSFIIFAQTKQSSLAFLPNGYNIFETISGDLNNDDKADCVLLIKATAKNKIIKVEHLGIKDRNRRGIIVLFKKETGYKLVTKNEGCFSSENEDGGVYFAPDLNVNIKKGNLCIDYGHGRYGSWGYNFRYKNNNFELIGYDNNENNGPVLNSKTSINFITKKKIVKLNTNKNAINAGEEKFKTIFTNVKNTALTKLTAIKDFNVLDVSVY